MTPDPIIHEERKFGSQSMVDPLRRVLVRRPDEAYGSADPSTWHYQSRPELEVAQDEHDALVAILDESGAQVIHQEHAPAGAADAIFTHDPSLVTDAGAILLRMGKSLRSGEPAAVAQTYEELGIPLLGSLLEPARAEGGDLLWLDRKTLAAGRGYRTNAAGLDQLSLLLSPLGVELIAVPLPHGRGRAACLHLMSLISMIDHDLAVVYAPLLPVPFLETLEARGIRWVEVPDGEFPSMGPNVLAVAPRSVVVLEGNPITRERLEAAGCRVRAYKGVELSAKSEGGPTCLTRPLLR